MSIDLSQVTVRYTPHSPPALDEISLSVAPGEIVALLGPNGAGKTTLIKVLCGLVEPERGQVRIFGQDVTRRPETVRRFLGVLLYPERSFYFRMTGRQNLLFFAAMNDLFGRHAQHLVDELLRRFGLWDTRNEPFMKYSLGTRKKLALARAVMTDAPVLLLDEPTANLDPVATQVILSYIEQLRSDGHAVLLATHHLHEAERMADRVAFLKDGALLRINSVDALKAMTGTSAPDTLG